MKKASGDDGDAKEAQKNIISSKEDSYKETVESEDKEAKLLSNQVKENEESTEADSDGEEAVPVMMKGNKKVKHQMSSGQRSFLRKKHPEMFKEDIVKPLTEEQEEEEAKDDNLSNSTQKRMPLRKTLVSMKKLANEGMDEGDNPLLKEKQNIIQATEEDKDDYKDFMNKIKEVAMGKLKPKDLEKAVDTEDVDVDSLITKGTFTKKQLQRKMEKKRKEIEESNKRLAAIKRGRKVNRMRHHKRHVHPRLKQDETLVEAAKEDADQELTELAKGTG